MPDVIDLLAFKDERGVLAVAQNFDFPVKRVFYLTEVNVKHERGLHAHRKSQLLIICARGRVTVVTDDCRKRRVLMLKSHQMLRLKPRLWHHLEGFQKDTLVICLSSEQYNETDYIRDYHTFQKEVCKFN